MYENRVFSILYDFASPYLGPLTGREAIELACMKAEIPADQLHPSDFPAVMTTLRPVMRTLLGERVTEQLLKKMETRLGLE